MNPIVRSKWAINIAFLVISIISLPLYVYRDDFLVLISVIKSRTESNSQKQEREIRKIVLDSGQSANRLQAEELKYILGQL